MMNGKVFLVTGGMNAGKTKKMAEIYEQCPGGDGFLSRKIYSTAGSLMGYELVRLSSREKMPLAYKTEYVPVGFDEIYRYGPFLFSGRALVFATGIMNELMNSERTALFMDEIGPLELQGKGFARLLAEALNTGKDLYLTVRTQCVTAVIDQFKMERVELIEL
jgi:nucleoside-triphosphatase THEP1